MTHHREAILYVLIGVALLVRVIGWTLSDDEDR